jgi:C-terminal processing protease CtpA/Prc
MIIHQSPHTPARLALALFALTLALAFPCAAVRAQSLDRIERERAHAMLGVIKDELKKNYYDPTFRGMDVDARFKLADEKIKQAASLNQAFGVIAQALLDLNDSHTTFSPPSRSVSVEYGWQMQAVGDKTYVVAVRPGSDAEKKGLKPGDLVISVENFKPTRKELWKMDYYYYTLSPRPGLRLVVQSPGGEPRQLDVAAKVTQHKRVLNLSGSSNSTHDINDYIRESEDSARLRRHRFQKFGSVIAWNMASFSYDPSQADSIMNEQVKAHGALILDLRGNGGGYVETLERLTAHFFNREIKIADRKGRKEMKPMVARKNDGQRFEGNLVVLIDSKSASASELFARLVQLEKRGIVIGDRSMGAVMQSRFHVKEMGHNTIVLYGASITDADVIMADGKSLEHVGVTPDEIVLPTAEDLASGRDPVMARAAELLGFKLDPEKAGKMFPVEWK